MRHSLLLALLAACGAPAHAPAASSPAAGSTPAAPTTTASPAGPIAPPALRLPDDIVPTAYRLRLEIDPAKDGFSGRVDIDVTVRRATDRVWLNAHGLQINDGRYTTGGRERPLRSIAGNDDVVGYGFDGALPPGPATLQLSFGGSFATDDVTGLFRQEDGGHRYVYSQLEPTFARRAFPSFDEPRWKTPWQVTLVVPRGQSAFSNMPIASQTPRPDGSPQGSVEVAFAPTQPLPSYLVAIAVGPFETVDVGPVGRGRVPARIVVPAGRAAEAAVAVATTRVVVDELERYFDMPLPLAKLDQIAVPSFPGAMENPGLVTYSQDLLLAKAPAPEAFRRVVVWAMGHELAHQWFGDLVTLAWWDDLWLNESFAQWLGGKVSMAVDPRWVSAVDAVDETNQAMTFDAGADAKPMHRPIRATDDILAAFDGISYQKGRSVLAMFERWIGPDRFRDGVRAYLRKHANGSATSADFQEAIASTGGDEVRAAFAGFLDRPGVPLVHVELGCEGGAGAVSLRQEPFMRTAAEGWSVPVCVRPIAGRVRGAEVCTLLGASPVSLAVGACPDAVVANGGAVGYYRTRYEGDLPARLTRVLGALAPEERLALAADRGALAGAGLAGLDDALGLARALLGTGDAHDAVAAAELVGATAQGVDDAHRAAWQRWVVATFGPRARRTGLVGRPAESALDARARRGLVDLVAVEARDAKLGAAARALATAWLDGRRAIPAGDLQGVLNAALTSGDAALFERAFAAASTREDPRERRALLAAMMLARSPAQVARGLELFLDARFGLDDAAALFENVFPRRGVHDAAWAFLQAHFDAVIAKFPVMVRGYVSMAAVGACTAERRREIEAFLAPRVASLSLGPPMLAQTLGRIDRCVALRATQADAVARFFTR